MKRNRASLFASSLLGKNARACQAFALSLLLAFSLALIGCAGAYSGKDAATSKGQSAQVEEPSQDGSAQDTGSASSPDPSASSESGEAVGLQQAQGGEVSNSDLLATVPEYSGQASVEVNGNVPGFTEDEIAVAQARGSYDQFSELDSLGRCGVAEANVGRDIMPTEKRGRISSVKPTGWHSVKYDGIDGDSLYNRCHLVAHQLTGQNANWKNLITGTRYLNIEGMLPYEEETGDYVRATGNHVLYRVTPVFQGDELVARGVHMEARSIEDDGAGVSFNVYCYNVQPGIGIDYATGDSWKE